MPTITLTGCAPVPLAHYLKALGILRLVAEQLDSNVKAAWRNDRLELHTGVTRDALVEFFLSRYAPTPIVAPWNGGSGFYEGDEQSALEALSQSSAPRLGEIQRAIETIRLWPQLGPTKQALSAMLSILGQEAAKTEGKAASDIRDLLAEFGNALDAFVSTIGQEKQQVLEWHIEQAEDANIPSDSAAKKAKSSMLKAAKKVRSAFKRLHRASGKEDIVLLARSTLSDSALNCIDAMVPALSDGHISYPPLFGIGGTDGRLEFTNKYLQCLCEIIAAASGLPTVESTTWLRASLFQETNSGPFSKSPIGQFFPGAAGGANSKSGFDGEPTVNPWDFVLMMEGGMLFAGAAAKKLDSAGDGSLVCPFCVTHNGAGFASASRSDEAKAGCEIWTPLWEQAVTFAELRAVFSEGRVQLFGSAARNGVDFAQAAVTLGVDRGISAFQRYAILKRNGQTNFATPLGKFTVQRNARADLLADAHSWMARLRIKTESQAKPKAPNAVKAAFNLVERRIMELCQDDSPTRMLALLAALGAIERAVARSFRWAEAKDKFQRQNIGPLRGLRPDWLERISDCTEVRLAASLASSRASFGKGKETLWFRQQLEPLKRADRGERFKPAWSELSPENDVAWHDGDLTDALNAILSRRLVRVEKSGVRGWPDWSPRTATLADITAFIEHRTNDALLADLIWGLCLVDWAQVPEERNTESTEEAIPSSFYALLRLCLRRATKGEDAIPLVPAILRRAINGQGKESSVLAARRLRASGQAPLVDELPVAGDIARRTAAAMLFPISPRDFRLLEHMTLKQQTSKTT
jgi:CRISPR-associated protein Csx17